MDPFGVTTKFSYGCSPANLRLLKRAEDAEWRLRMTTAATASGRPRNGTAKRGVATLPPSFVDMEDAWVDLGDLCTNDVVRPTRSESLLEPLGAADHPPRRASARLAEHGPLSFSTRR